MCSAGLYSSLMEYILSRDMAKTTFSSASGWALDVIMLGQAAGLIILRQN